MQQQLYPAQIIEFSKEYLLAKFPKKTYIIYMIILLLLIGTIISLPLIKVSVTVQSTGIIRPLIEKQEIKSVVSGFVTEIFTKGNFNIEKNQKIIVLNSDKIDKKINFIKNNIFLTNKNLKDLNFLTENIHKIKIDSLKTSLYKQDYNQFKNELKKITMKEKNLRKDFEKLKKLYKKNMVPKLNFENKKREINQIKSDKKILVGKYLTKWEADLSTMNNGLKELNSNLEELKKDKELYIIKSPLKGSIEQFQAITTGKYIGAGQTICVISPNSKLIAEMYVTPKDIGLISQGNDVNILIDSFNYNDWGTLKGKIIEISNDFIVINNNPVFKIRCSLNKDYLQLKNGFKGKIKKGMTFQSRFIITERTLYQLLFDNINDWLNPYNNKL